MLNPPIARRHQRVVCYLSRAPPRGSLHLPEGSTNFGFLGQFSEMPKETIITMEYSIRSARQAVATLRKTGVPIPPVYQGQRDPHALYEVLKSLA